LSETLVWTAISEVIQSELASTYLVVPDTFSEPLKEDVFIKVGFRTEPEASFFNRTSIRGQITFQVYVRNLLAPKKSLEVISSLSEKLNTRQHGRLQLFWGSSQSLGTDPDNRSLVRTDFTLPFRFSYSN
jgi:hypothetical protein